MLVMASQGGKTDGYLMVIGEALANDSRACLVVLPTKSLAMDQFEPRLDSLIRQTAPLNDNTVYGHKYKRVAKLVNGGSVRVAWGGRSTSQMKMSTAAVVVIDELGELSSNISGQGDAVKICDARHNALPDGITLAASSPGEAPNESAPDPDTGLHHFSTPDPEFVKCEAWSWFLKGSRHELAAPCYECREYFIPKAQFLFVPGDLDGAAARAKSGLICPNCGSLLQSTRKPWMRAHCVYVHPGQKPLPYREGDTHATIVDTNGEQIVLDYGDAHLRGARRSTLTLWCSGLLAMGANQTFEDMAMAVRTAKLTNDPDELIATMNTDLGEPYTILIFNKKTDWQTVMQRRAAYRAGEVPERARSIIIGVDVQSYGFPYCVRAIGPDNESWLIEYDTLLGDTLEESEVWDELTTLCSRTFGGLPVSFVAIDSGYNANRVYDWASEDRTKRLVTKGEAYADRAYWYKDADDKRPNVSKSRGKVRLWHIDTDRFKSYLLSRVHLPLDGSPGQWWIPEDVDKEYARQIASERRTQKGRVIKWEKHYANHWWDCEVLIAFVMRRYQNQLKAMAEPAKEIPAPLPLGVDVAEAEQNALMRKLNGTTETSSEPRSTGDAKRRRRRKSRGNYLTGGRR